MLNLSKSSIKFSKKWDNFSSIKGLKNHNPKKIIFQLSLMFLIFILILLFVPWTQNIASSGQVTTFLPEDKPQTLQSIISGQVEKWYVSEGDFIKKNDTIVKFSEVKTEYFDPNLVKRTGDQIDSKESILKAYQSKIGNINTMLNTLEQTKVLKVKEAEFKTNQSKQKWNAAKANLKAIESGYAAKKNQYERTKLLQEKGLKSVTELENKELAYQEATAKLQEARNKVRIALTEMDRAKNYSLTVSTEYDEKIAKAQSDRNETASKSFKTEGEIAKNKNQYENYKIRNDLYYLTAPQDGYVSKLYINGIGELVKEGEAIMHLSPTQLNPYAEVYIDPIDLPLVQEKEMVYLLFDGWPAVVFSGWPELSVGVFRGTVISVENFLSSNGKYRVLIKPSGEKKWPTEIRMGTGIKAYMMLKEVPIWYELWRQINGFPKDYYKPKVNDSKKKK